MELESIHAVFRQLNEKQIRYLVIGGLAVVAHGYVRATKDMDLIIDLEPGNIVSGIAALEGIGYRPLVPVPFLSYADPAQRKIWREEKGAVVFQVFSDAHPTVRIDLFLEEPLDFEAAWQRACWEELWGVRVPVASFQDLTVLKQRAGRPQDIADLAKLQLLRSGG